MRLIRNTNHRLRLLLPHTGGAAALATFAFLCLVTPVTPLTAHGSPVELTSTRIAVRAPAPSAARTDPLAAAVAAAQGPPGAAQIGVAMLDRTTGKLTLGRLGAVPFLSASVVKLITAVDVLRRAEVGAGAVSPAQRALIRRALAASDDAAMSVLWNQFGGPRTVTELAGWAHLRDTHPPADAARWAETKLSARDVVGAYTYLLGSLNPADRQLVLESLRAASPRGADGFDQSFGMLARPRRAGVAAKQGWMMVGPAEYLHSTGLTGQGDRYVIVVLTKRPAADGFAAGCAAVTASVARLVSALSLGPPAARPPARQAAPPASRQARRPAARPAARPAPRPAARS